EPLAADDGVGVAGLLLLGLEAVLVGLLVHEAERVGGLDVLVALLEAAWVDQLLDARAGADAEVVLAVGADVQGLFDVLAEQHVAALGTAQPQAFRDAGAVALGA